MTDAARWRFDGWGIAVQTGMCSLRSSISERATAEQLWQIHNRLSYLVPAEFWQISEWWFSQGGHGLVLAMQKASRNDGACGVVSRELCGPQRLTCLRTRLCKKLHSASAVLLQMQAIYTTVLRDSRFASHAWTCLPLFRCKCQPEHDVLQR